MSGALRLATLFSLLMLTPAVALADPPAAYQGDPGHTGIAQGATLAPPLGKRWVRTDLGSYVSYPVMAEGKVFVAAARGVYALDPATGATLWTRSVVSKGVAYDAGKIFAVDGSGTMQALAASNGATLWATHLQDAGRGSAPPTAYGGDLVYVSAGARVFGVRESDGLVLFSTLTAGGDLTMPAADEDRVYVTGRCGEAAGLQRTLGIEEWHRPASCGSDDARAPVLYGGDVYVAAGDGGVTLDDSTGSQAGSFTAWWPPAFAGGIGYFADPNTITARSVATGTTAWRATDSRAIGAAPLVAGGYVYDMDVAGKVFAVDRATGARVWESVLDPYQLDFNLNTVYPGLAAAGNVLVVSALHKTYSEGIVAGFTPGPDASGVGPPPEPPAKVTLSARKTNLTWADLADLEGTLNGTGQVDIHASAFPFKSEQVVKTLTPNAYTGRFETSVEPRANTVYWATSGGASSKRVVVFVDFYTRARMSGRGRTKRVTIVVGGPVGAPLRGRRVYVYGYRAAKRRAVRLAGRRLKAHIGPRVIRAQVGMRLRVPPQRRGDYLFFCLEEKRDDGFGKPDPADAECGHKVLR